MDRKILESNKMDHNVVVRELPIIYWKIQKNRGEGEKFSLTGERVRGIQSSCQLTEVPKTC